MRQQEGNVARQAILIASPELWHHGFAPHHPLKPERLARTMALLRAYGALDAPDVRVVTPRPASDEELSLFHTSAYIEAVKRLSRGDLTIPSAIYGFGPGDNPIFPRMDDGARLRVGGGLQGAALLLSDACQVAFNLGGGFHHAHPAQASGFCIYNDVAIAIRWLVLQGQRVAYVDIDAHHGDGVQEAFYTTDQVLTISLHQDGRTLFPGTGFVWEIGEGAGEGYSVNLPFLPGTDDEIYLWAFEAIVPPMIHRFRPDVLVTQLGVDTHFRDPLTHLQLTTHGHEALFKALAALSPGRWLATGGGGYDLDVVPRAWTLAFGVMTDQTFPDPLPEVYKAQFGGRWLHDHDRPHLTAGIRARARQHAEQTVAKLKELLSIG